MVAMVVSILFSGRDHRSLDGGPWPGERSARSHQARKPKRRTPVDGFFAFREERRRFAAGEKSRRSRCGKAIEAKPPLGPDPSIRGCVRSAPKNGLMDH